MIQLTETARPTPISCDPASRITKSLLGYGVIAGPVYVAVSLVQALTRHGFHLTKHAWSLLSTGDLGWIQITNFLVTGVMTIAFAIGLRRALRPGCGVTWVPRLVGTYGAGLIGAGIFRPDPALGFPAGTPQDASTVSWHGALHIVSGGIGFACLIAACLIIGSRYAAERHTGWAWYSRATGVIFFFGFAGISSGSRSPWINMGFTAAIVLAWAWVSVVSCHQYRRIAGRSA